ncbi:glycerophosphodiester phosphodiesterase [Arthrobacter sp. MYb227]|uniref:glycerophosphodiester phosphodiesterase n=1 Tax=Arthrobacter sp. MYb227 TaxID=1848601 RepID=UPI000CFCA2DD|nr:glycerophosphodiester phosphodiesterase [Arthrobacter sp. MYb227]PQZ90234.1 glycerophosphodiester phosphodiesterase [Arthrobacter sp. MYb227]
MDSPRVGTVPYLLNVSGGPLAGQPLAFAHRGFAPSSEENTIKAFRAASDLGFRYLETDVHTSKDGILMVFHDETLQRLAKAPGRIKDYSAEQLKEFRVAGEKIPTFEELLVMFPDSLFNVDLKDSASATRLAEIIEKHEAYDRILIASFAGAHRVAAQKLLKYPVATSPGFIGAAAATLLSKVSPLPRRGLGNFAALQVPEFHGKIRVVTKKFIDKAHDLGIQVHVWVVNETTDMHRILDLGVDGIMSDRADLLAAVMQERGHWPQTQNIG